MKKWAHQLEAQRRRYKEHHQQFDSYRPNGTSETEFEYMRNQPRLENPYARMAGDEDDDDSSEGYPASAGGGSGNHYHRMDPHDLSQSRNASQTSLRSRSTTGESTGHPPSLLAQTRAIPPRLPPGSLSGHPALSLRTQQIQQGLTDSPGERNAESYFSPTGESPSSSARTSSASMYPFPRQQYSQNGYYNNDDNALNHARYTAPAVARPAMSRESTAPPVVDGYAPAPPRNAGMGPRGIGIMSAQALPAPRNRSASSPDIHQNRPGSKRVGAQPPIPDMPAPYQMYNAAAHVVPRSQSNSPALSNGIPARGTSTSPNSQRERSYSIRRDDTQSGFSHQQGSAPSAVTSAFPQPPQPRGATPTQQTIQGSQTFSSPSAPAAASILPPPTQLKVKVHCPSASQVLTLVVPLNISYQSLKDRIDAKLQRSTNLSLGGGVANVGKDNVVKLKYLDEDDFVTIQTDEDVQEAFDSWREQMQNGEAVPGMGEIELFCQR